MEMPPKRLVSGSKSGSSRSGCSAENPLAVGLQISLRRLALDLVAQGFLALIGVRNVELVEDEQRRGEDSAQHEDRQAWRDKC